MAIKKVTYQYDNGSEWDEIMFKTTADQVKLNNGKSLQDLFINGSESYAYINQYFNTNNNISDTVYGTRGNKLSLEIGDITKGLVLDATDKIFNFRPYDSAGLKIELGMSRVPFKDIWLGSYNYNEDGYTKLSNGLILQWGWNTLIFNDNYEVLRGVTLPIAFPNSLLSVQATGEFGNTDRYTLTVGYVGTTKINIYKRTFSSGTSTDFCFWMAIGY